MMKLYSRSNINIYELSFDMNKGASWITWLVLAGIVIIGIVVLVPMLTNNGTGQNNGQIVENGQIFPGSPSPMSDDEVNGELTDETDQELTTEPTATIDEIVDDPSLHLDQQVIVEGNLGEILVAERAFTLESMESDNNLIVITQSPVPNLSDQLVGDNTYQVLGTVREFSITEVENDYGVDLDDDFFADMEGQSYIWATQVQMIEGA